MPTRKRSTSETGAYMSQYDQEVEKRLDAIEAEIKSIKESLSSLSSVPVGGDSGKIDALINRLNTIPSITEHCAKDADGVRRIKI